MFQKFLAVLMVAAISPAAFAKKAVEADHETKSENKVEVKRAGEVKDLAKEVNKAEVKKGQEIVNPNAVRARNADLLSNSGVAKRNSNLSLEGLEQHLSGINKGKVNADRVTVQEVSAAKDIVSVLKGRVKAASAVAVAAAIALAPAPVHADVQLTSHAMLSRADLDVNKSIEAVKADIEVAKITGDTVLNGQAAAEGCLTMSKAAVENLQSVVIEARKVAEKGSDAMYDAAVDSLDRSIVDENGKPVRTHEENAQALCLLGNTPSASQKAKGVQGHCNIVKGKTLNLASRCSKI